MKNLLLTLLFIGFLNSLYAQEKADSLRNNEIKINVAYPLLAEIFEISYENILNEESALGFSLAFAFSDVQQYRFLAIPYYRIYFGKKRAAGFFFEANAAIFSAEDYYYDYSSFTSVEEDASVHFGLGIAIGGKFVTKNGTIVDLVLGLGRNLTNDDDFSSLETYPRLGISFGKRF